MGAMGAAITGVVPAPTVVLLVFIFTLRRELLNLRGQLGTTTGNPPCGCGVAPPVNSGGGRASGLGAAAG